jgi:cob(I)alamin adenosyltransferase
MKIYTKTGDDGSTGLLDGKRVLKSDKRIDVYGTIDELNSIIGISINFISTDKVINQLKIISNLLFILGSELAISSSETSKYEKIDEKHILWLEKMIDELTYELPLLRKFILPGGKIGASYLHLARTVCRRAERLAVGLSKVEKVEILIIKFINRLSDYFFTASRYINYVEGSGDEIRDSDISQKIGEI